MEILYRRTLLFFCYHSHIILHSSITGFLVLFHNKFADSPFGFIVRSKNTFYFNILKQSPALNFGQYLLNPGICWTQMFKSFRFIFIILRYVFLLFHWLDKQSSEYRVTIILYRTHFFIILFLFIIFLLLLSFISPMMFCKINYRC